MTRELPGDAIYGIRKSLIPVMNALRDRGHEVILLDQEAAGKLPQPLMHRYLEKIVFMYLRHRAGIGCQTTRIFLAERVRMGRIAAAFAKKEKIKIVHFHDPILAYAFRIFAFFFRTKCRWGYTAHAYGRFVKNHIGICIAPGILRKLQRWENNICRKAGWVIIPSQSGREQLALETGMDAGLPYWYTIPHIVPEITGDREMTRQMLGLKPEDILLLAVGQLIPMKRFHLLVEALAHVQSPKNIMALILGNGEEKEKLSALALSLKIRHTLEFRVTDSIGDYLAAADLYVSVSATEAFGMANCEAIKAGLPAICTLGGAVPELLGDAFLMTSGEPEEIARQIDQLIEQPEIRTELTRRAKSRSAVWPGNEFIVDELEKVYYKALNPPDSDLSIPFDLKFQDASLATLFINPRLAMRILHVTRETGSDSRYGIRKGLLPVVRALEARGHYVEIFDQDKAIQQHGFLGRMLETVWLYWVRWLLGKEIEAVKGFISERIQVGRRAARYAARGRFTHVHCHDPLLAYVYHWFRLLYGATPVWGYSLSAYGRFVKKRIGIQADEKVFRYLEGWEIQASVSARWVLLQTHRGMEQMRQDLGIEIIPAHWYVVGNPVAKYNGDRSGTRRKLGIKDHQKLILAVGQLIPMKRFDLLLQALSQLPNDLSFFVVILGEGPEREKLSKLAESYGFGNRILFTVTDHIGDFYAAADLYVSTSSTESYANASCEAVLAGLPAVCTAVGGVPELLQGGAVLTGDEPEEIADAIYTLLTSDEMRRKLLAEAQRITAAWNPPEFFAAAREKILQGCCRNHFAQEKQPDTPIQPKEKTLPTAFGEFRLRAYREEDRKALMDLWQCVFGKEMDPKVWDWKYRLCPYPVLSLVCLNAEGQPVVFYAGIAYPCRHYGRYGEWVHLVDNMTHPGYRQMIAGRQGLFLETARHFSIENETAGDCRYFYGFPGERNHKLAKLFLNCRDFHSGPAYLVFDLPDIPAMHQGDVFAKQLKLPSAVRLDAFWHRVSVHYPVSVIRDHLFLQWRYFRHPVNTYRFYVSKDITGRYNAWVMVKQEEETLILVDMLFSPGGSGVPGLLARIRKDAMKAGIRKIVTWLPQMHFITECLLANGFVQLPEPLGIRPIGRIPAMDVLPRPWVEGEVYYTMGDGDVC